MAIDVGALRLFQSTWKPVIDAIPDVINMAAMQVDLDRELAAKKKELADAEAQIKSAFEEANRRLTNVNQQLEAAVAGTKAAEADTDRLLAARERELAEAGTARKKTLAATEKRLAEVEAAVQKAEALAAQKIADAEAAAKAKLDAAETQLQAIEAKRQAAEAVLESLRSKLG